MSRPPRELGAGSAGDRPAGSAPWCDCAADRSNRTSRLTLVVPELTTRTELREVSTLLHDLPGVVAVEVDLPSRSVRVDGNVDEGTVVRVLTDRGYAAIPP